MTSLDYKRDYFKQHGGMDTCDTSPMTDYGTYVKTYVTGDRNILTEVNGEAWQPETWTTEGGYTVTESVRAWRTEIWTTTDARSRVWYERY